MMKNTLWLLILCILATETRTMAATKVFLLAGQLNMAGEGTAANLPSPYNTPQTDVHFWNSSQWVSLQGGFGDGSSGTLFGPEVTFGYTLRQLFPKDDIYLVKYGLTSTSLAVQWNPNGSGACYNTFKTTANAALANLSVADKSPTVAGMIWMQGENDALNATYAAAYAENLSNLIARVRSDFSTPEMPFVAGRILSCYGTQTNSDLVRNALMTVPGQVGHGSWINTDDLPLAFTGHYGTDGQIEIGIRFANELASVPEPSTCSIAITGLLALAGYCLRRIRRNTAA